MPNEPRCISFPSSEMYLFSPLVVEENRKVRDLGRAAPSWRSTVPTISVGSWPTLPVYGWSKVSPVKGVTRIRSCGINFLLFDSEPFSHPVAAFLFFRLDIALLVATVRSKQDDMSS